MSNYTNTHLAAVQFVNSKRCWENKQKRLDQITKPKAMYWKKKEDTSPMNIEELNLAIPGLKHVLDAKKGFVFNAIWFLVIGCSFFVCSYQIYNRLTLFLSDPVDSRVTVKQNETVKFPSFTVCAPEDRHIPLIPHQFLKAKAQNIPLCNVKYFDLMPELNISVIWKKRNTDGLIDKSVIVARLNGDSPEHTFKTKTTLTYYGNCTTYSINELVPFRGEYFKVHIKFHNPPVNPCGNSMLSAVYYFHHDDEDITYKFITGHSLKATGRVTVLGLEAKEFKVLDRSSAPCDSVAEVNHCERRCIENILKKRFSCRLPYTQFDDIPLCTNSTQAQLMHRETFDIAVSVAFSKNCSCPNICEKISYSKNLVFSSGFFFPVTEYHYESNVIIDIREYYSYTIIPFICDVGGNLGLFLGLCIPTIIDVIQNVVVCVFTKIVRSRAA